MDLARCPLTDRNPPALLTPRDVAARWQVSVRMVQNMIERGELPAVRLGPKLLRIRPETVEALEAALCPAVDVNDQPPTVAGPPSGTSYGAKVDQRIALLRARRKF